MGKFLKGFLSLFQAIHMYKTYPFLRKYSVLPFIINVVLIIAIFSGAVYFGIPALHNWIENLGEGWIWSIISTIAGILATVVFLILALLMFIVLANVISSPFNDILSEKLDRVLWEVDVCNWQSMGITQVIWKSITEETRKIFSMISYWILLLPLNLIPVIGNTLYMVINFYKTFLMLALEFTGYCLDRRGYNFKEKIIFVKKNRLEMLGFGAGVALLLAVPVINLFLLPVAVVSGTSFCVRVLKEKSKTKIVE